MGCLGKGLCKVEKYLKNDKVKELIRYFIAGGLTTLVNMLVYRVCAHNLYINYLVSTIIAWIIAVLFAFFSNKFFVFRQNDISPHTVVKEFSAFVIARLATGALDIVFMWTGVSVLAWNDMIVKFISNVIVIILNYILGKFLVFAKKKV